MREMWPWRDWVIVGLQPQPAVRSVHHLAARRRPAAERRPQEQRIATGFNRNHMQSQEGGIVAEEYRTEYVVDRVEHARPRLPRPQRRVRPLPRPQVRPGHAEGVLPALRLLQQRQRDRARFRTRACRARRSMVTTPEVDAKLAALRARIARARGRARSGVAGASTPGFARWLATAADAARAAVATPPGLIAHFPLDRRRRGDRAPKPDPKPPKPGATPPKPRKMLTFANAVDAEAARQARRRQGSRRRRPSRARWATRAAAGRRQLHLRSARRFAFFERNQPFSLGLWFRIEQPGTAGPLVTRSGGVMNGNRGYEVMLRADGTLDRGPASRRAGQLDRDRDAPAGDGAGTWHHLALTYDGSSRAAGVAPVPRRRSSRRRAVVIDHLQRSIVYAPHKGSWGDSPPLRIGRRQRRDAGGRIRR